MDATVAIGKGIIEARKKAGLTQVQLAELAGVSDRTVRGIEQGSPSPSFGTVVDVLDVLGLTLEVKP